MHNGGVAGVEGTKEGYNFRTGRPFGLKGENLLIGKMNLKAQKGGEEIVPIFHGWQGREYGDPSFPWNAPRKRRGSLTLTSQRSFVEKRRKGGPSPRTSAETRGSRSPREQSS